MAEVIERVAKLEEQFNGTNKRLDRVDASITRVEGRLDSGLSRVEGRLDAGFTEIKQSMLRLDDRLESRFKWMMGGIASGFLAVLLLIIGQIVSGR